MKTESKDGTFDDMIASFSDEMQALAQALRALIDTSDPDVVEVVWLRQKIAGYGVGPKKLTEHYCYIAPQSKHVNLGFNHGVSLPDPDGLLAGTGKAFRHVKVTALDDTLREQLAALLAAAEDERHEALST